MVAWPKCCGHYTGGMILYSWSVHPCDLHLFTTVSGLLYLAGSLGFNHNGIEQAQLWALEVIECCQNKSLFENIDVEKKPRTCATDGSVPG